MAKQWAPGELLLTLHQERRFRQGGYKPDTAYHATLADAVAVDAKIKRQFADTWHLPDRQGQITSRALAELYLIERAKVAQ